MSKRLGIRTCAARRRAALAVAVAALFSVVPPASAVAEQVHTSQATRAGADASTWAPMPVRPAAICLIDSGTDLVPDTSSVVARLAVDGGTGADVDTAKHGTRMAMIAAATHDGWGTVGIAPGQPIVSMRAMREGRQSYYFDDWRSAILRCRQIADLYNVRVISLSLGRAGVLEADAARQLADVVGAARSRGISVVAAAGNTPGPVETPASYPPVLSVAAGAQNGALCSFAAGDLSQDAPADLVVPGCSLDAANVAGEPVWANGSSHATAIAAGVLAQLFSHRPDLTPDDAEGLLLAHATQTPGGRAINVAAAWAAAGLHRQLEDGAAARPAATSDEPVPPKQRDEPPPPTSPPAEAPPGPPASPAAPLAGFVSIAPPETGSPTRSRWDKPRVTSVRERRGVLVVRVGSLPRGTAVRVAISGRARGREFATWTRTKQSRSGELRLSVPHRWKYGAVVVHGAGRRASEPTYIRPSRQCARICQR